MKIVEFFANELQGVRKREWNSERAMIFIPCILNRKSGVRAASSITKTIARRIDLWKAGRFAELVEEAVVEARVGVAGRKPDEWNREDGVSESVANTFNSMVLDGKLRAAVRFATERGTGGPRRPDEYCSKSGQRILDVLKEKHPSICVDEADADGNVPGFDQYGATPVCVPHASDEYNISVAGGRIHGGAGPSGVDAMLLKHMLLRFGTASLNLRVELALWSEWLSNESPPWAAIRAINAKRAVALDKMPGTRPLHVGEVMMRMLGKELLMDAGDEAKVACGSAQLCAGLEAGVEGGLHSARAAWKGDGWSQDEAPRPDDPFLQVLQFLESDDDMDTFEMEEPPSVEAEGMALVDASNGFNRLKRYQALWTARHRWAKGSRLAFNCYRHHNIVIVRRGGGKTAHVIHAEEGVSQGDPLSMALYGVALLPLAENLKRAVPEVTIPHL
eukprot:scaffold84827_cov23-Cyclotella_meneghiniana.AAC.1